MDHLPTCKTPAGSRQPDGRKRQNDPIHVHVFPLLRYLLCAPYLSDFRRCVKMCGSVQLEKMRSDAQSFTVLHNPAQFLGSKLCTPPSRDCTPTLLPFGPRSTKW